MSKSIILHIGTPKTGTSSIQEMLAAASAVDRSFAYPLDQYDNNHVKLMYLYLQHDEVAPLLRLAYPVDDSRYRRMKKNYRRKVFESLDRADKAILSAENLSRLSTQKAANLRDDLESIGYTRFMVVLYVRDPAEQFLSGVQQVQKFFGRRNHPSPSSWFYQARRIAETWESVFPGCLEVRKFPPDIHGDVITDFRSLVLKHLGITLPEAETRSNESLPAESIKVLQDYRLFSDAQAVTPDHRKLVSHLQAMKPVITQSKPILKKEFARHIRARHQDDFRFLRSRYGLEFDWLDETLAASEECGDVFRIDELVERCDSEIVNRLLLSVIHAELSRRENILSRVSRKIRTLIGRR